MRTWSVPVALAIVVVGVALRADGISTRQMSGDEIESTINALTILEHGVPVDSYLGQPIYENTLTTPWPESAEYEFRDSSYSDRGLAVYHSWIPLYSIAAALWLAGIEPDAAPAPGRAPVFRESERDIEERIVAPRIPSLVFSVAFMLLAAAAARRIAGSAAGWAALVTAALATGFVQLGSDARYYSATLAATAACAFTGAGLAARPSTRTAVLHGLALGALFHTHVLSCAVACAVTAVLVVARIRRPLVLASGAIAAAVVAAASVPWMLATGYLRAMEGMPKAWEFMDLPGDALRYAGQGQVTIVIFVVWLSVVAGVRLFGSRLPARVRAPVLRSAPVIALLAVWAVLAFVAFTVLMPLISYWPPRMSMVLAVPKVLFTAVMVTTCARIASTRHELWLAPMLGLAFIGSIGRVQVDLEGSAQKGAPSFFAEFARALNAQRFPAGARIYAEPCMHFMCCYYYGVPAQSIAPVRRSFLDGYPGEIVYIDMLATDPRWTADHVAALARRDGRQLTDGDAAAHADWLRTDHARRLLAQQVTTVSPPAREGVPPFLAAELEDLDATWQDRCTWAELALAFKGMEVGSNDDAWMTFYYRFVDPLGRRAQPSFRDRLRRARATVTQSGIAILRSCP